MCSDWASEDWTGLQRTGMGCQGIDWAAEDWTRLQRTGLHGMQGTGLSFRGME